METNRTALKCMSNTHFQTS